MKELDVLKERVDMAAGRMPVDLLLTNGRIVDVFSGRVVHGSLAVGNGRIVGIGEYDTKKVVDAGGAFLLPGLIDAHVHIESSMLTPRGFCSAVLPLGTTTVIADPHEIANVAGIDGIRYMIEESRDLPFTIRYMLPSCVPASPFENSGAVLEAGQLAELVDDEQVLGLGEAMNFPGVINAEPAILRKILLARQHDMVVDGHSPGLDGMGLTAYAAAGVRTDHECSTVEEMEARIALGMYVQIREGSAVRNLSALLKGVTPANMRRCLFCTDDREPEDIARRGHINSMLRQAVAEGIEPISAIVMATLNPAECYGLQGKGALAPGYDADILVVEDLDAFQVREVYTYGRRAAAGGVVDTSTLPPARPGMAHSVRPGNLTPDSFTLELPTARANVISIVAKSIITVKKIREVVPDEQGMFQANRNPGLTKVAVVERHKGTGNIGLGLLENYGLVNGAIGTTIAHDAHNIVIAGDNDEDMFTVVQELERLGGGIVLCREGEVVDALPLPIGGLMCELPAAEVGETLERLLTKAHEEFAVNKAIQPFMTLSFMSLSVIPELKLTDRGLLDVTSFALIDLCVSDSGTPSSRAHA